MSNQSRNDLNWKIDHFIVSLAGLYTGEFFVLAEDFANLQDPETQCRKEPENIPIYSVGETPFSPETKVRMVRKLQQPFPHYTRPDRARFFEIPPTFFKKLRKLANKK